MKPESRRRWGREDTTVDLTTLKTFLIVTDVGSISGAARRLGYSQSACSLQVTALESSLRKRLFLRRATGVTLTDAGRDVYPTTSCIVYLADTLWFDPRPLTPKRSEPARHEDVS